MGHIGATSVGAGAYQLISLASPDHAPMHVACWPIFHDSGRPELVHVVGRHILQGSACQTSLQAVRR